MWWSFKEFYVISTHFEKCKGAEFLLETRGLKFPYIPFSFTSYVNISRLKSKNLMFKT